VRRPSLRPLHTLRALIDLILHLSLLRLSILAQRLRDDLAYGVPANGRL
jgi:hypothetical protein